eukprot:gene27371-4674_t
MAAVKGITRTSSLQAPIMPLTGQGSGGIKRTSGLQAPIMQLTGHGSEVLSLKFSPDGAVCASGSADKLIYLWRTYGECQNYMSIKGHKNAVLE